MNSRSGRLQAITGKDYVLTVLAAVIFIAINFIFLSLAPVYTVRQGHGEFLAGFQNTFFSVLCVVFRFYLGPMADRKGRKGMMLLGSSTFVAGPMVFWFSGGHYGLILAGRLLMAVGMASFLSAVSCYVAESVSPEHRGFAIGVQRSFYSVALMVAPVAGLAVADSSAGFSGLFILSSALGVLSVLLVLGIRDRRVEGCEANRVRRDTALILGKPLNRKIYLSILTLCLSYGILLSYITLYLGRFPAIPSPGIYFTVFAASGLLGSVVAGVLSDRFSRQVIAQPALLGMGVGMAMLFLVPVSPVIAALISGVLTGACFTGGVSVLVSWLVDITPAQLRGTALGLQESNIDAGIALGSLFFGTLTLGLTFPLAFLLIGAFGITVSLMTKSSKEVPNP